MKTLAELQQAIRTLHAEGVSPTSAHYYCDPGECDKAGEGDLVPWCWECDKAYPCPTLQALDGVA